MKENDIRRFVDDLVAFNKLLGIHLVGYAQGEARMDMAYSEKLIGDPLRPALHGGAIGALIDTCGGAAVWSAASEQDRVSTIDLRIDYLRPAPLKDLSCLAKVQRIGSRVGVADMKVWVKGAPDDVVATGKGVYHVKRSESQIPHSSG